MAKGMNWGIFSLLAVVVFVLGSIATFFVFLAKRSATPPANAACATISPLNREPEFAVEDCVSPPGLVLFESIQKG